MVALQGRSSQAGPQPRHFAIFIIRRFASKADPSFDDEGMRTRPASICGTVATAQA
jgi:hypothetical protein